MTRPRPDPEREAIRDTLKAARALLDNLDTGERDEYATALRQAFAALDRINPTVR